jgi:hypothetical protein
LHCVFQFALKRKYIGENPTAGVKHFDERHERPSKRMLTVEEERRILEAAPPHLRVAIVLLVQTGGRTYSEGLSLKSVGIVSSTADLAPHVGHKVELTGTAVPPKDAEMDPNVPKSPHYMKITGVKMISATCP